MRPPQGWQCSRVRGHDGPCAASSADRVDLFAEQMRNEAGFKANGGVIVHRDAKPENTAWPNGDDDIKPGLDPAPAAAAPSSSSLFERGETWSLAFLIGDDHAARIAKLTADPVLLKKILIAAARVAGIRALEARAADGKGT